MKNVREKEKLEWKTQYISQSHLVKNRIKNNHNKKVSLLVSLTGSCPFPVHSKPIYATTPHVPIDPSELMTQLGSPNPIQFAWTPVWKSVNSSKLCPLHGDLLAHVHETDHVRSVHHVVVQLLAFHRPEVAVTEIPNPVTHLTLPARCYGEFSGAQGREGL